MEHGAITDVKDFCVEGSSSKHHIKETQSWSFLNEVV